MAVTATLTPTSPDIYTTANCRSTQDAFIPTLKAYEAFQLTGGGAYIYYDTASSSPAQGVATFTNMPETLGIYSVTITWYAIQEATTPGNDSSRGICRIGSTNYYSGSFAAQASWTAHSFTWTVNPATGLPWTKAQVDAAGFGVSVESDDEFGPLGGQVTVSVSHIPVPPSVDVTRHVGSVGLWLKKRPEAFLTFEGNLDLLNLNLLDPVLVEHTAGPHATDLGWEDEVWQRRLFAVHQMDIDLNTMTVTARLKDQRPIMCLLRDLAWSDKASGSLGDGIATFATPGAVRTFTRASEHSFTNPVGETEIVPTDVAAYGPYGLLMLSASGGRAAPRYKWTNNSTSRVWKGAQGGFNCEVYLAAVSGSAKQTVAYAYHDASNWHHLYYDGANGRAVFEVRAAGVTYRAIKAGVPSANTVYQIGARWTGSNLELGATAYTISVWVDRVKGTDDVAAAAMTEQATAFLDFGSSAAAGTEQLNGSIRKIHVYQYVPTDVEMARQI